MGADAIGKSTTLALRKAQRLFTKTPPSDAAPSERNDSIADRILNQFRRRVKAQGLKDARLVDLCGPRRDLEDRGHLLGRSALSNELQDFMLARREALCRVKRPGI